MIALVLVLFLALLAFLARLFARLATKPQPMFDGALGEPPTAKGRSGPDPALLRRTAIGLSIAVVVVSGLGAVEASVWHDRSGLPIRGDREQLRDAGDNVLVMGVIADTTHACTDKAYAVCADGHLGLRGLELRVGDARVYVSSDTYRPVGWPIASVAGEQVPTLERGAPLVMLGDVRADGAGAFDFGISASLAIHGAEEDVRRALLWRALPGIAAVVLGLLLGIAGMVQAIRLKRGDTVSLP